MHSVVAFFSFTINEPDESVDSLISAFLTPTQAPAAASRKQRVINQSITFLRELNRKQVTNAKVKHNVKLSNNKTHTMDTAKDLAVIESSSHHQSYFDRKIFLSFSKITK